MHTEQIITATFEGKISILFLQGAYPASPLSLLKLPVVMQKTAKECTEIYNAPVQSLH